MLKFLSEVNFHTVFQYNCRNSNYSWAITLQSSRLWEGCCAEIVRSQHVSNCNQPAWINTARSIDWLTGCLVIWIVVLRSETKLWLRCFFAGEPLGGRTAAGIPRGYWSFSWVAEDDLSVPSDSTSGEWDTVSPPQTDGQAEVILSSKDSLLPIGHDTWHPLSISTYKLLCLACPGPSAQSCMTFNHPVSDPWKGK